MSPLRASGGAVAGAPRLPTSAREVDPGASSGAPTAAAAGEVVPATASEGPDVADAQRARAALFGRPGAATLCVARGLPSRRLCHTML